MSVLNVSGNIKEKKADPFVDHCQFTVSLLYHRVMVEGIYVGREVRENVIMVTNGVRIVVTAGHLRIMVTTEGV